MLSAFKLDNNHLARIELENKQENLISSIWIDLVNAEYNERALIHKELGQILTTRPKLKNLEAAARFFEDGDGLHIYSSFFYEDHKKQLANSIVVFIIRQGRLYTLRDHELPAFRLYYMKIRNKNLLDNNVFQILLDLFENKVEQLADEIETIYNILERLNIVIIKGIQNESLDNAVNRLKSLEDNLWKLQLCLIDTQRVLNFLIRKIGLKNSQLVQAKEMLLDNNALLSQNESLFQKINFLKQAANEVGNNEQNRILKIFSVISVIFLLPTLIASIYGMNFELMPELTWKFGYPFVIGLMVLSALVPYIYFKRKNWL